MRDSHKTVSTDHNFWRERRAEADSNRGPSAYQPNALPLDQTGSPDRTTIINPNSREPVGPSNPFINKRLKLLPTLLEKLPWWCFQCSIRNQAATYTLPPRHFGLRLSHQSEAECQTYNMIQQCNLIAKCQCSCTRNVVWCQVHSSPIHASHKTSLIYNNKHWGKKSLISKYVRKSNRHEAAHITSKRPLYEVCLIIFFNVLIKANYDKKKIYNKLIN